MTEKEIDFNSDRKGTGTMEWAEVNENISTGCRNNCLYCYAAHNAQRFKMKARDDWHNERFTKRADIKSYPARDGVIMFPSAHDITPFNVEAYIRVAKLMLEKGNKLLIVSKPKMSCIIQLLDNFKEFKDQILFRFSIGSLDPELIELWEPGATSASERISCLEIAKDAGYKTSVSIEPMLSGVNDAATTISGVRKYVSDTIWVGKMNKTRLRVPKNTPGYNELISELDLLQGDEDIINLYNHFKNDPMVKWKDSIKSVIEKRQ